MPTPGPTRILVLTDGSLPALVATLLAIEEAANTVFLRFEPGSRPAPKSRRRACQRLIELYDLPELIETAPPPPELPISTRLLHSCHTAIELGCRRLVWPVSLGDDLDAAASAAEHAACIERLLGLEVPRQERPQLTTPLLDLTRAQIADLAHDLDAPLQGAWWCQEEGDPPRPTTTRSHTSFPGCGACPPCQRWLAHLSDQPPALAAPVVRPRQAPRVKPKP